MQDFVVLIMDTGKTVIHMAFYILLPIMVVMMALMRFLERNHVLYYTARFLSPLLFWFGLPGIGAFAMLQISLISFAAPLSTLAMVDQDKVIENKRIAATLAMVFTMSQANSIFPLLVVGLNLWVTLATSIGGGLLAAAATYYFFTRGEPHKKQDKLSSEKPFQEGERPGNMQALLKGGQEGVEMSLRSIPMWMLAMLVVNLLKMLKVVDFLEKLLNPLFQYFGLPGVVILPLLTKFFAGGTAMMVVTMELVEKGAMSALHLNRIAGFMIHPFDIVGLAFYATAGKRVAQAVRPAVKGALVGILARGVVHFLIF